MDEDDERGPRMTMYTRILTGCNHGLFKDASKKFATDDDDIQDLQDDYEYIDVPGSWVDSDSEFENSVEFEWVSLLA